MSNQVVNDLPKLVVFGAGGLGIEMVKVLTKRPVAQLVGIVDKTGFIFNESGLNCSDIADELSAYKKVSALSGCTEAKDNAITEFLNAHSKQVNAIFYALPNIPNSFIPELTKQIINQSDFNGVIVDALKRTSAVEALTQITNELQERGILYLTGCGATPGILTSAAALAAQSFVEVEEVCITFGVGIANWQAYRATVREDIAHMEGFSVDKVSEMSEEEIDAEIEKRNGLLELVNMEHADDIMLELAGVCSRDKVTVGGVVDTRNPKKPLSTNVQVTGLTYDGKRSTNTFTLGDETTMAANVNGSVLGFLNAGYSLWKGLGVSGLRTAAEVMPAYQAVTKLKPALV
ncbi:MAG TPA: hypothetical protein V6C96_01590 [Vampirovibrionales bacterium]